MSDIFDHYLDAVEDSWNRGYLNSSKGNLSRKYYNKDSPNLSYSNNFKRNPFYYNIDISFFCIIAETEKSYLLKLKPNSNKGVWIPKVSSFKKNENCFSVNKNCITYCESRVSACNP